jgi:hypothetical protein
MTDIGSREEQRMTQDQARAGQVLGIRLAIGLAQGLVLYLLAEAVINHAWPATNRVLNGALVATFTFVPLILIQGLGLIRVPRLLLWSAVAATIAAGLGSYDAWRAAGDTLGVFPPMAFALYFFLGAGLFIAHALILGGDADRRFMATYPTHFDVAWKLALQLILTTGFAMVFWALLWLGAGLFQLIGLGFLKTLITHRWFATPATALVVAAGIHLTDIQPGLVRGTRTLVLVLFSWLLPLMTVLAVGFLAALPFKGLQPLWHLGHASAVLLGAAAWLVILINAMYQDGQGTRTPVLKYAGYAAALSLVPLVALAGYAISLRVTQHGWTADRVVTVAAVVVAGFYAVGYAASLFIQGGALRLIERWNFCAALLILVVLLALFSPLVDPARIAVNDQMARLRSGVVPAAQFDFNFLRNGGVRFGHDALVRLAQSPDRTIRTRAEETLQGTGIAPRQVPPLPGQTPAEMAAAFTVYPKGASLPQTFLNQHWGQQPGTFMPRCEHGTGLVSNTCEALVADLDGDGKDEVLLLVENTQGKFFNAYLYQQSPDSTWSYTASLGLPHCDGELEALRAGQIKLVPTTGYDALIAGRRQPLSSVRSISGNCPAGH